MERWIAGKRESGENPKIDAFIEEVIEVCKKHGLSISHEDGQGGFIIEQACNANFEWLQAASDETDQERQ